MDSFSSKVRTFDAFPKVSAEHSVRSQRGGLSTVLTVFFMLLIAWIEIGGYLGGYTDRRFAVDKQIRLALDINVDMVVAMPCLEIVTNVMDITSDTYMAGEVLNMQGVDFHVPEFYRINSANDEHETKDFDEIFQGSLKAEYTIKGAHANSNAPACHVFGTIPVNHVRGEFFIIGRHLLRRNRHTEQQHGFNFSHVIYEFSYGDFYPYLTNPLDATAKVTDQADMQYKYFAKVVPTLYEKLGVDIDVYQYSLTEIHQRTRLEDLHPPGIYFTYGFEPIKLSIRERRLTFLQFVAKLATILLGLLIAAGYLLRLYERLLYVLFGRRYVERDAEKKEGGLLDKRTSI